MPISWSYYFLFHIQTRMLDYIIFSLKHCRFCRTMSCEARVNVGVSVGISVTVSVSDV